MVLLDLMVKMRRYLQIMWSLAHGGRRRASCNTIKRGGEMQAHQYFKSDLCSFMRPTPESLKPWKISLQKYARESPWIRTCPAWIAFTTGIMRNRRCALIERTGVPLTKAIKCSRRQADWSSQACRATQSASDFKPVYLHLQTKPDRQRQRAKWKCLFSQLHYFWHVI